MSMKFAGLNILLVAMCFGLTGCPDASQDSTDYSWTYPQSTETVGSNWSIDQVSLKCSDPDQCPANQGVLVAFSRTYAGFEVQRCTGTIIGPHTVLTAGHCVDHFKGSDQLWFKTVATATSPSRTFHASTGADVYNSKDTYSADYGIFTLSEAATGYQYSAPAKTVPNPLTKVKAIVVNGVTTDSMTDLKLDVVPCDHESDKMDRVTYDMNPTAFLVVNCKIYSGNSGGSVTLADNLYAVVGVVSASNNAKSAASDFYEQIMKSMRPGVDLPPKIDDAVVANVRCASMQDWPQMIPDCMTMSFETMTKMTDEINSKSIIASTKTIFVHWIKSPSSQISLGSASLQAIPIPAKLTDMSLNPKGVIIPAPLCINGKITRAVTQTVSLALLDPDAKDSNLFDRDMVVSIKPVSPGTYHVQYLAFGNLEGHPSPNEKNLDIDSLSQGIDLPIPQCKGDEVQNVLNEIDKLSVSAN